MPVLHMHDFCFLQIQFGSCKDGGTSIKFNIFSLDTQYKILKLHNSLEGRTKNILIHARCLIITDWQTQKQKRKLSSKLGSAKTKTQASFEKRNEGQWLPKKKNSKHAHERTLYCSVFNDFGFDGKLRCRTIDRRLSRHKRSSIR